MPKLIKPEGSKCWVMFYTDHTGKRRKKTFEADKAISERLKAALLEKVRLRKDGLVDERDEKFAEHEGNSITDHLDAYLRSIESEGVTRKHVNHVRHVVTRILKLGRIKRVSDLSLTKAQDAIAKLRQTHATETINAHIQRVKSFSRWLWLDKRAREYALVSLHRKDAKNDRKHVRRRVTDAEIMAVIAAAEGAAKRFGLSGPDRAMLYRIAYGTGFRAKELRSLVAEQFRLHADPPTITVLAAYTKNGEEAVQPIQASLADLLRPWLATKPAMGVVFKGMSILTADMLKADLEAAGVPYRTSEGVFDFHSSRVTYISNLVSNGVSVKTCQVLARHSDPALTIGIYAKTSLHDIRGAVEGLPNLTPSEPIPARHQATGTYDDRPKSATDSATFDADEPSSTDRNGLQGNALRCVDGEVTSARDKRSDPWSGRRA